MPTDELMKIREVAELIGVTPGTLLSWRYKGTAPNGFPTGFRIGSDRAGLRWKRSEVVAWLNAQHATQEKATA